MFELKRLTPEGIGPAMEKVERYRLLNEPVEAESICVDVLEVEPGHEGALISLLLAITDQFGEDLSRVRDAKALLERLPTRYQRLYYSGIIAERVAKAHLRRGAPGAGRIAYDAFREAMDWYERAAETERDPANVDAIIRWNTCARLIVRHDHVEPTRETATPTLLE